jgi:[acyl-carrier-protein] S-malonyltransferase
VRKGALRAMGGVAFLFGGPGLAEPGMGKDLYNKNPLVRESLDKADKAMNELGGVRPTKACFAGTAELIHRPSVSGPAVLALAHGVFRALKARRVHPNAAAGLGWGELVALGAMGAIDYEAALKLLYERGLRVEEAWAQAPWYALAVQGLDAAGLEAKLDALPQEVRPRRAALIAPDHFVLSGDEGLLKKLHAVLAAAGRGVKLTPVEPGWQWPHSALAALGERTAADFEALPREHLATPLQGAADVEASRTPRDWPARLRLCCSEALDWPAAGRRLRRMGVDTVVEVGHGAALGLALHSADHGVRALATADAADFAQAVKLSN